MTVRRESGDLCGASEGDMNGVNKLIIQQHLTDIEHDFKAAIFILSLPLTMMIPVVIFLE